MVAKHLWRASDGSIYGYCSCGRELKFSEEYTDKKCPLCGAKIIWDLSNFDDKKSCAKATESEKVKNFVKNEDFLKLKR